MEAQTHDELREKLLIVLTKHVDVEEPDRTFPMDTELTKLGLDSLNAVNLLLDLEDAFVINFPDSMLQESTFRTAATLDGAIRKVVEGTS